MAARRTAASAPVGWAVVVCLGALTACSGAGSSFASDATGPLTALPECAPAPPEVEVDPGLLEGAELPEGAVLTSALAQDPIVNLTAYVDGTPVEVRNEFELRRGIDIIVIEDEVFEAELLVSNGTHRTYLRVGATCSTGSTLIAVVAPELEADALPLPPGAFTASPTPGGGAGR